MPALTTTATSPLMNVPYGNDAPPSSERSVGNCFAVISRAPLEQGLDGR
jgi:hypothetical protein